MAKLDGANCYKVDGELTLFELRKVVDARLISDSDSFTVAEVIRENLVKQGIGAGEIKVGDFVDLDQYRRITVGATADGAITSLDVCPAPPPAASDESAVDRPEQRQ